MATDIAVAATFSALKIERQEKREREREKRREERKNIIQRLRLYILRGYCLTLLETEILIKRSNLVVLKISVHLLSVPRKHSLHVISVISQCEKTLISCKELKTNILAFRSFSLYKTLSCQTSFILIFKSLFFLFAYFFLSSTTSLIDFVYRRTHIHAHPKKH